MDAVVRFFLGRSRLVFDEIDELGFFDLDQLIVPIIQGQNEVEKIRFAQIGRRLFFEVTSMYANAKISFLNLPKSRNFAC